MSSHAAHPAQATPAAAQAAPAAALPLPFAGLAAELRLHAGDRAEAFGPVAAIQALILALLARLLGRLDALFASWQHGQLPLPAPAPPAPHPTTPGIPARTTPTHTRTPSVADWLFSLWAEEPPARAARPSAPHIAPGAAPPRPAPRPPRARPRQARAQAARSLGAPPRRARTPEPRPGRIRAHGLPTPPRLQKPGFAAAPRRANFIT